MAGSFPRRWPDPSTLPRATSGSARASATRRRRACRGGSSTPSRSRRWSTSTSFAPRPAPPTRAALGIGPGELLIGWVGRLDRKKRVEDFLEAAALVHAQEPAARFLVIGGPDAFMPEYALALRKQATALGLDGVLRFLGDRADVPDLLAALDVFVWLSRGEGMPHVIAEAGAAGLPVVATADNGALQQIEDGVSGLFVPHESPGGLPRPRSCGSSARRRCGRASAHALRTKVAASYAAEAVVPQWRALFEARAGRGRACAAPAALPKLPARRLGMLDAPPAGRPSARYRRRDRPRRERRGRLSSARVARDRHDARRAPLAPDRSAAGTATTSRAGRRCSGPRRPKAPKSSGTCFTTAGRTISTSGPLALSTASPPSPGRPPHISARRPTPCPSGARSTRFSFLAWAGGDAAYLNPFAAGPRLRAQGPARPRRAGGDA